MRKVSITLKIAIWYALFMVILAGSLTALLISAQAGQERTVAERELVEITADASEKIANNTDSFMFNKDIRYYVKEVYISTYDVSGELIVGRRPHSVSEFPELEDRTFTMIHDTQGFEWFVYDSFIDTGKNGIWIRGMMRHVGHDPTGTFLLRFLLLILPVFIFLAVLGGLVITRRLFRPLREIISTTEEIRADGDVSKRIPLGRSHDELYELTRSINAMFGTLEDAIKREKQFSSDVSHELRTPVAVIQTQSEYAMEDPGYREQALAVINREARHMNTMIGQLLLLAQSDSRRIHLENELIDLSALLMDIAEQQQITAGEENVEILTAIDDGIFVRGDEMMLIRIVMNLVSNAVKYGRTPSADNISASKGAGLITISLREENGRALCTVSDKGPGIPAEDQARVWDRFYQIDPSRTVTSDGSSGLGLSIVQALTKAMGGSVSLRSEEGQGAAFTVSLPAVRP